MATTSTYQTWGGEAPLDIEGQYRYLSSKNKPLFGEWDYDWHDWQDLSDENWTLGDLLGGDYDVYGYQGISSPVMQALNNVFGGAGKDPLGAIDFEGLVKDKLGTERYDIYGDLEWGSYGNSEAYLSTPDEWRVTEEDDYTEEFKVNLPGGMLSFTDVFDAESIAQTLSSMMNLSGDSRIRGGEVRALTPDMLEKTESQYYEPVETAQRASLIDKLAQKHSKAGTGGFAGSGARRSEMSSLDRLYRGGYEDIIADIMKLKGQSLQDVLDTVYSWAELGTSSS